MGPRPSDLWVWLQVGIGRSFTPWCSDRSREPVNDVGSRSFAALRMTHTYFFWRQRLKPQVLFARAAGPGSRALTKSVDALVVMQLTRGVGDDS
jgi:hypothetical protein